MQNIYPLNVIYFVILFKIFIMNISMYYAVKVTDSKLIL